MAVKQKLTIALIIIMTITPLIINPFSTDYFYYPKILFIYTISLAMAGFWFLNRNDTTLQISVSEKILKYYMLLLVISTVLSIEPLGSLWGTVNREEGLFAIIAYFFLLTAAYQQYNYSRDHVKLLLLSACIVAFYGITQYFGYDPVQRDFIRMNWSGRAFSTIGNPNFLGSYLTLMLPISVYAYVYSKRLEYLITSGTIYMALLCTMTRGAWLGALVAIVLLSYFIIKSKNSLKHLAIVLSLFILISILLNQYSNGGIIGRFLTISQDIESIMTQSADYEKAGANRIFIWVRVIELIKEKPIIGYGLETLDIAFTERFSYDIVEMYGKLYIFDKAHNEYLNIAVSSGIPSLFMYLALVSSILFKSFKNLKHHHLIIPLFCSIVGYLVQSFFNISVVSVAYIYWIFLGLLLNFSLEAEFVSNAHALETKKSKLSRKIF